MLEINWPARLLLVAVFGLVFVGVPSALFIFARRFLRAYERRSAAARELADVHDRLSRVEERVDDLASAHEHLAEGQRFTAALQADRPASDPR